MMLCLPVNTFYVMSQFVNIIFQNFIVVKNYFTLECLNHKLDCFDYGNDLKNKPSPISRHKLVESTGRNLRQNGKAAFAI